MQKKLIALAIAALASGAASAQSNVTVYGVADASFESVSATGATNTGVSTAGVSLPSRSRISSNSSYIGFKGAEDLGNGLRAVFQIESQFAVDNATNNSSGNTSGIGTIATRDTYVGVASNDLGAVQLGFLSTPHRLISANYDVMPGSTGGAGYNALLGHINIGASRATNGTTANTFAGVSNTAVSNINAIFRTQGIGYNSPSFSGVSAALFYSPNENKPNSLAASGETNPSVWNAALKYDGGAFKAAYSVLTQYDSASTNAAGNRLLSQLLAGMYTIDNATTVSLMYNRNEQALDGNDNSSSPSLVKNAVWWLGVRHVMGAHELAASYAVANDGSVTNTGTNATPATADERGAKMIGLRYGYNFSKRTQAYAMYSKINNKANGIYDFGAGTALNNSQAASNTNAIGAGADPRAFGIGLRHSF
ncbi:MAG: porin [Pseudomonadota bacterium]